MYWLIMFTACRAIGPVTSSRMITGIAHNPRYRVLSNRLAKGLGLWPVNAGTVLTVI
jgi:hypothetical protein